MPWCITTCRGIPTAWNSARDGWTGSGQILKDVVKTITIWGRDNEIDQVVLDVKIRKARKIRHDLGIAVPVPANAAQVIEAVVENVLLRRPTSKQLQLGLAGQAVSRLHQEWDRSANREKENRAYYKHPEIHPEEVARDLEMNDRVLGDPESVRRFIAEVMQRFGGSLAPAKGDGAYVLNPGDLERRLNSLGGKSFPARVTFDRLKDPNALYLGRTRQPSKSLPRRPGQSLRPRTGAVLRPRRG